jgi:hypothetical protein
MYGNEIIANINMPARVKHKNRRKPIFFVTSSEKAAKTE